VRRKVIVVTGASGGIGAAAARRLARNGHTLAVVGRSSKKTAAVAAGISADHFVADFADLNQVRRLAALLSDAYPLIDVLANNAGCVDGDRTTTVDGFERWLQVNHLAPFLLTTLLMDRLVESKAAVIQTTMLPRRRAIDLTHLGMDKVDPLAVCNAAKLENVFFTRELHARYHSAGISSEGSQRENRARIGVRVKYTARNVFGRD
jgi:NAD(P)-dependent dehydrogenase (short-subunit alcohol dehydrogenase family)